LELINYNERQDRANDTDALRNPFDWTSLTYRTVAIGNVLVVLVGLLFLVPTALKMAGGSFANSTANSYFRSWFRAMTLINLCFLTILTVGGIHLFRLGPSGVNICNAVFLAEICYSPAIGFLWYVLPVSNGVAAATGVGNMGISPQVLSGYPVIALVFLNLAGWKRTKALATITTIS
jgi:hypothetical protein